MLLPFIEATQVYNAINFNVAAMYPPRFPLTVVNQTIYNMRVAGFMCPSDPESGRVRINNYQLCIGATSNGLSTASNGMFANLLAFGVRDCTDGTSNTIALSEALVGAATNGNHTRQNGVVDATYPAGSQLANVFENPNLLMQALTACSNRWRTSTAANSFTNRRSERWGWGTTGVTMFNTVVPPNSKQHPWSSCRNNCPGCGADGAQIANANSQHPGGVNVTMADGSVRFIKDAVSMQAWWSLGTRAGGEVISSDAY